MSTITQIPFTRGVPSADLLPVDDLKQAAVEALESDSAGALGYAPNGYLGLREWVAERHGVTPDRVLLVNGSLQGVCFVAQHLFAAAGGVAVVEDPTYDRTLTALRTVGAQVRPVAVRADGVDADALAAALDTAPAPRLVYLIPTFQNPAGVSIPAATRRVIVEVARDRGALVLEDDPYGLLRFEGEAAPTLHELDGGDNVIYSSSFTKTVAPGVRTGYLVLPAELVVPMSAISANTYIGPNSFSEATLAAYCRGGRFEPNVERATNALRERRDAMEAALAAHFPAGSRWTTPEGGYFFWVELPPGMDTSTALANAVERGVPYVKGSDFTASEAGRRSLRLAFSAVTPLEITEGIARLGELLTALAVA